MQTQTFVAPNIEAAEEFNRHEHRCDGMLVVESLTGGLTLLRNLLYARLRFDVEKRAGSDSMFAPLSEARAEQATRREIELYQIAVSARTVAEHAYVGTRDRWYLQWLARLRLGEASEERQVAKRLGAYLAETSERARLAFTNALATALPSSTRAPLVLFRLVPLAVEIATHVAFGNHRNAVEARKRQAHWLPAVLHCHACCAKILENGEECRLCGNPLWNDDWLTAFD